MNMMQNMNCTNAKINKENMRVPGLLGIGLFIFAFSSLANANCWIEAGNRYQIDPMLLVAIAKTESGLRPNIINVNTNGSWDYGLMQINSIHMKKLGEFGIDKEDLTEPCQQIMVGAWILAMNIKRLGNNWNAVGAYNVGCAKLSDDECARRRTIYVSKVKKAYRKMEKLSEF